MSFNQAVPVVLDNVTTTAASPKNLLDVNVGNSGIAGMPTVYNVSMPLAATEYSFTFPIGVKKYSIKTRLTGTLQYTFQVGDSGTTFITLNGGSVAVEDNLNLPAALTIYFQSNKVGNTLEIVAWT